MSEIRKVYIHDGVGNPISSYLDPISGEYILNIHNSDVHTGIVNSAMHRHTAVSTTLTVATVGDGTEYQISVADATGFANNDYLHIADGSMEITHPMIISSVPALPAAGAAVFTLDRRLDNAHAIGTTVTQAVLDISSTAGTLATPVEYWVGPPSGEVWHLARILFAMAHGTAGDLGTFGDIAGGLTNGVLLRAKTNGSYSTLTNWKTNGDMKADMYDVEFDARSGGGGSYGTSGRGTFTRTGAIVRLDGDNGDRLELLVQDSLTTLGFFIMQAQGHIEGA